MHPFSALDLGFLEVFTAVPLDPHEIEAELRSALDWKSVLLPSSGDGIHSLSLPTNIDPLNFVGGFGKISSAIRLEIAAIDSNGSRVFSRTNEIGALITLPEKYDFVDLPVWINRTAEVIDWNKNDEGHETRTFLTLNTPFGGGDNQNCGFHVHSARIDGEAFDSRRDVMTVFDPEGRELLYLEKVFEEGSGGIGRFVAETVFGEARVGKQFRLPREDEEPQPQPQKAKSCFIEGEWLLPQVLVKVATRRRMCKLLEQEGYLLESPMNEIRTLQRIAAAGPDAYVGFAHLMRMEFMRSDAHNIYVGMPFLEGGSLYSLKYDIMPPSLKSGVPQRTAKRWFRQIVSGVAALHTLAICHLDISLENVFISGLDTPDERVVLGDFGMSVELAPNPSHPLCLDPSQNFGHVPYVSLGGKPYYHPYELLEAESRKWGMISSHIRREIVLLRWQRQKQQEVAEEEERRRQQGEREQEEGAQGSQFNGDDDSFLEGIQLDHEVSFAIDGMSGEEIMDLMRRLPVVIPINCPAVDSWMLGICLLLLLTPNEFCAQTNPPLEYYDRLINPCDPPRLHSTVLVYDNVAKRGERPPRQLSRAYSDAHDLLDRLLAPEPAARISAHDALNHRWLL